MIEIKEEGLYSVYIEYHSTNPLDYGMLVMDVQGKIICNTFSRRAIFVVNGPINLRASCFIGSQYTRIEDIAGHNIKIKQVNHG